MNYAARVAAAAAGDEIVVSSLVRDLVGSAELRLRRAARGRAPRVRGPPPCSRSSRPDGRRPVPPRRPRRPNSVAEARAATTRGTSRTACGSSPVATSNTRNPPSPGHRGCVHDLGAIRRPSPSSTELVTPAEPAPIRGAPINREDRQPERIRLRVGRDDRLTVPATTSDKSRPPIGAPVSASRRSRPRSAPDRPLSVALRRSDVRCDSPTVATLATMSPAPPSAAIRAASWTPLPWKSPPTCVASEAWRPIRTCGREALRRAVLGESPLDRDRRRHREVRRVEADEEPVAGRRDLLAVVGREHLAEGRVVPAQHRLPRLVAERLDEVRRADDVGEHERLHDPPGGTRPCRAAARAGARRRPRG